MSYTPSSQQAGSARFLTGHMPTCTFCNTTFGSVNALRQHKKQKAEEENKQDAPLTHIYCHICDQDFRAHGAAKAHWEQNHAQKQDINCPGCGTHFGKFSGFVQHIECKHCPKITQSNAAARNQMNLDFARSLQRRDEMKMLGSSNGPKDFTPYLDIDSKPIQPASLKEAPSNPWQQRDSEAWGPSGFDAPNKMEFPRMAHHEYRHGNSKVPDLLTGDEISPLERGQGENPWASYNNIFVDGSSAQWSASEQVDRLQADQGAATERGRDMFGLDPDNPDGSRFDADRYFHPYLKKYKCPKCCKSFKNKAGLVQHLRSPAHTFKKTVCCPVCLHSFDSLHALAAHCESASKSCGIRHSEMYEIFLSQLTWDLIEVTGTHQQDGTKKYDVSHKAKEDYGVVKPVKPLLTFGHQQVHSSQSSTPHLTQNALVQHQDQHQQMISASWQNTRAYKGQPQQQQGSAKGSAPLTAETLSKWNAQMAKAAEFRPGMRREEDSATDSAGPGNWATIISFGEKSDRGDRGADWL